MYEIQRDVPVPPIDYAPQPKRRKYPFEEMAVGDMFFVPDKDSNTLAPYVGRQGKKLGRTFVTRTVYMIENDGEWVQVEPETEDATKGIGVWRTN